MKRSTMLSILVLLAMVLVILPASLGAEGPAPEYDVWQYGPDTAFTWYRHDCAYFDSGGGQTYDQKVYCLGGRPGQTHEPDVWQFDPVTSAWTDTGADMPVHASNYTARVLTDTNGIGIYMVAGYLVASDTQTDTVQVYYPDANTAVVIDTDPLPAIVPGGTEPPIAGGQEVVDGLLYYFGGWNSNAPPNYTSVETWVYDPFAPAGSRWSQLADMNLGRGYIISAQVDGKIYAIGGDTYDGANLIAQTIVERYDPATDTWDDAGVADMPVACDEARAVGFDSDSPLEFRGQLVTMGCGQWTAQIPECMLYDTTYDFWDPTFPDLNSQRRNHGGTFIPDLGVAGTPGMWVFGGLDGAPLQSTEYYEVGLFVPGMELVPSFQAGSEPPGTTVPYTITIVNDLGWEETFDLTYDAVWPTVGPTASDPVPHGGTWDFVVEVTVPADSFCYESDLATIMAVAQSSPVYSDTASIETTSAPPGEGNLAGTIYDANTGLGIPDAYVYIEVQTNDDVYVETHTLTDGHYLIQDMPACVYDAEFQAMGYLGQYGPQVVLTDAMTTTLDVSLGAAAPELSHDAVSVSLPPTSTGTFSLGLTNNGVHALTFHVTELSNKSIYPTPEPAGAMPSGVDPQVYADLAASPDGTAPFIVYLAEQADLSAAFGIHDRSARGHYVLNTLRSTAEQSQASLRADLDRADVQYEPRYIVNALVVEGNTSLVDSLIARPEVAFVGPNAEFAPPDPVQIEPGINAPGTSWGISRTLAISAWEEFNAYGEGIIVANIDTGVDYDHAALVNQYRGNTGGGSFDHNYNWWDPYGLDPDVPYDGHNHGSHTMGTMVGSDNPAEPLSATEVIGMAPRATWFTCQGFANRGTGSGYSAELLECAEFILAPWDLSGANPDPDLRADVVNNSWGGGQAQWWYNQTVYAWRAAGILPIFSAGNDGYACETAGDPGDMANILAVGATDEDDSNAPGSQADFSSRGPAQVTGLLKPNVSAPGVNIWSAYRDGTYGLMQGTSQAAPHVSGLGALIWSAVPELHGDVQLTYWVMEQSAEPLLVDQGFFCGDDDASSVPNNQYGWGRIDAFEAISLALSSKWDISWLDVDPVSGVVEPGESVDIQLAFDTTGLDLGCFTDTLKIEFNDPYIVEEFLPVELCVTEPEPPTHYVYLPIAVKNH